MIPLIFWAGRAVKHLPYGYGHAPVMGAGLGVVRDSFSSAAHKTRSDDDDFSEAGVLAFSLWFGTRVGSGLLGRFGVCLCRGRLPRLSDAYRKKAALSEVLLDLDEQSRCAFIDRVREGR